MTGADIPEVASMQIVRVDWIDSASCDGWQDSKTLEREFAEQDFGGATRCVTVGFLWRVGPRDIAITATQQPSNNGDGPYRVLGVMSIPRAAITGFNALAPT